MHRQRRQQAALARRPRSRGRAAVGPAPLGTTAAVSSSTCSSLYSPNHQPHAALINLMMQGVPFILQGVPPSQLESLKIHVQDGGNCYMIRACMPGVRREDVDIQIDDSRTLKLAAIRREPGRTAHISRNTILPKFADPNEVEFMLDDAGNLTIQVMKIGECLNRKRMRFS